MPNWFKHILDDTHIFSFSPCRKLTSIYIFSLIDQMIFDFIVGGLYKLSSTLNCLISVGYYLEICVAITFY